eukprot:PhM_4_TR14654/c2_g2_i1/m.90900
MSETMSSTLEDVQQFYAIVSDSIDQLTSTRRAELVSAFTLIYPTAFSGKVQLVVVSAGSTVVRFVVVGVPSAEWPALLPHIKTADLSAVGITSNLVASAEVAQVTTAYAGTNMTACGSEVRLTANAAVYGLGRWYSNATDVVFTANSSATTTAMNIPVGVTSITWRITNLDLVSESTIYVTRLLMPSRHIEAPTGLLFSNTATVYLSSELPPNFLGTWSILSGSGQITAYQTTLATISGFGTVTVEYKITSALCTTVSTVQTVLTFPAATSCTKRCDHGECVDGNCVCHASDGLGYFHDERCSTCAPGYTGNGCKQRVCETGGATCQHGVCNISSNQCDCHRSAVKGYWSGVTCSVCASSREVGFWQGSTCTECQNGFSGPSCKRLCVASIDCSGHGVCSRSSTAMCECFSTTVLGHWSGVSCDKCQTNYLGSSCAAFCEPAV